MTAGPLRMVVFLLAAVLAGGVSFTTSACATGEDKSRDAWSDVQKHLNAGVSRIQFWGPGEDSGQEIGASPEVVVAALVSGRFDEDNPSHFGPTTEVGATFYLKQGEPLNVGQWPDGRFEMAWKGRQFLVDAPDLAAMLEEAGFVYK